MTVKKSGKIKSVIDNTTTPLIAVDFDNTLCDSIYPSFGPPIRGAKETLQLFKDLGYLILIYSCRSCHWHYDLFPNIDKNQPVLERDTVLGMREWLIEHQIPFDEIDDGSKGKPFASYYIDDKGIRFNNNWKEIADFIRLETIKNER